MQRTNWRFVFDGKPYEYHGYVGAPDAILIKKHAGLGVLTLFHGVMVGDPEALVALVFLAKRHAGEDVTWDELAESMVGDNDLLALVDSLESIEDEAPADEPADEPTEGPPADEKPTRSRKTAAA